METVKLSPTGQIVIPKGILEYHHLSAGTEFSIAFSGDEIRLKPLPVFAATRVEEGLGMLARNGVKRLAEDETGLAIGAMLKEADEATKVCS